LECFSCWRHCIHGEKVEQRRLTKLLLFVAGTQKLDRQIPPKPTPRNIGGAPCNGICVYQWPGFMCLYCEFEVGLAVRALLLQLYDKGGDCEGDWGSPLWGWCSAVAQLSAWAHKFSYVYVSQKVWYPKVQKQNNAF